ncbi:hypothetical protein [Helicobacter pylori]|uniref:hypothetical protein n=1 Tax=Helicobacter pylori TaxID=210 RepID=UPI00026B0834|nr:hypothetical protein [Helicobacter pylori]EJB93205.1 hypothetical protein HPHPH23_1473 [Helicobacter pylori Hp H-23]
MRQRNETDTSFNKLREITLAIQAQKNSVQTSDNANTSEITSQSTPKPKGTARAKNSVLKPPKQKSQSSLAFGMNALVPLGTI